MAVGIFARDILKALRDCGPMTPVELWEGDDDHRGVTGPLDSVRADCGQLRKSRLIEDDGMVGSEHRYRITEWGRERLAEHYEQLRREVEARARGSA